ncbi:MAG: DUF4442 domain-containing protein [Planctomycetales bacterium]|nr:DUF4442 domain-containing protein [Planctomycetales bacterium]
MKINELPFNRMLGLQADGLRVLLVPQSEHGNHVNTVHATVLFGLAEASTGHLLMQRFPELADSHMAVLRESSTKFRRPAEIGSQICAEGMLSEPAAKSFLATLNSRGRTIVEIGVSVTQDGSEVLTGSFRWFVATR